MNLQEILLPNFDVINLETFDDIDEKIFKKCICCKKRVFCIKRKLKFFQSISNQEEFFCNFCLRHGFYKKRKIFILSFRNLFAHLYYQNLYSENFKNINFKKIIENHKNAGSENPLFLYDEDTLLWFIDFSKLKLHHKEIFSTIYAIIESINANNEVDSKLLYDVIKKEIKDKKNFCIPDINVFNILEFNYSPDILFGFSYKFVQ